MKPICKIIQAGQRSRRLINYIAGKTVRTAAASEVRHIVISCPKGMPSAEAMAMVKKIIQEWNLS